MDLEARSKDDRVELTRGVVVSHDRVRANLADRVGYKLDIGLAERGVVPIRKSDPLAAERVGGGQSRPELGVGNVTPKVSASDRLEALRQAPVDHGSEHRRLVPEIDPGTEEPLRGGQAAEQAALEIADRSIRVRQHPRRGA